MNRLAEQLDYRTAGYPRVWISIFSVVLLVASSCLSECQVPPDEKPFEQLNAAAAGLRLEFRADLEIHALELAKPTDWPSETKRIADLYDQLSFATVQYPNRFASVMQSNSLERITDDSLAFYPLDGLSIRMRLLRSVADRMPSWTSGELKHARIELASSSCAEPSVQTAEPYYSALADLVFTKSRAVASSDYEWLQEHIRQINSPIQMIEIADLLARMEAPADALRSLAIAFESALERASATDRELGFLGSNDLIENSMTLLSERLQHNALPTGPLWASYSQFLHNSLQEDRCQDSITDWHALAHHLNDALVTSNTANVKPIDWQELQQHISAIHAHETPMPSEEQSDALLGAMYSLISAQESNHGALFAAEDKRDQLQAYMSRITQLLDQTRSSCEFCLYFYREKVLLSAFDMLQGTPFRAEVLGKLVADLASDPSQDRIPSLWYLHVQILLDMSRPVTEQTAAKLKRMTADGSFAPFTSGSDAGQIKQDLSQSNNPTIQAYVLADRLLGLTFSAPYLR